MLKSRFKKVTVIAAVSAVAALLAGCAQNLNAMDNYAPAMNSSMVEYDDTKKIFTNPSKEATQNYITGRFG